MEQRELQRSELKHPVLLFTSTYLPVLKLQWLKGLELKNQVPVRQSKSEQTFDSFAGEIEIRFLGLSRWRIPVKHPGLSVEIPEMLFPRNKGKLEIDWLLP